MVDQDEMRTMIRQTLSGDDVLHFLQEVEPNVKEGGHCSMTVGVQQRYSSSAQDSLTCPFFGHVVAEPDHLLIID